MSNNIGHTTSKLVGIKYTEILNNKIEQLKSELNEASRNRKIYESLILTNKDKVYSNPILNYIIDTNTNNRKYNKFKIEELYNYNDSYSNKIRSILQNSIATDDNRLIYSYYTNFMKYVILEGNIELKVEMYERLNISSVSISYLFRLYFLYISYELFRTNSHLVLPYNIYLRIVGKNINKAIKKYGNTQQNVDWKESLNVLNSIAKDVNPDLYNAYINKNIKKKDFIQSMKPYVYNKDTNPTGKKWIVKRDNDFNLWLVIWTRFSNLTNISKYSIVPTNFIATKDRSQINFTNSVNSIDEIITSSKLGFRDKLRAIERFDINYCLNTFDNDL